MSSQSGIIAANETISGFNSFVNDEQLWAIVLKIDNNSLSIEIIESIPNKATSLENQLNDLSENVLSETECLYLIFKYDDGKTQKLTFISYVPDNAVVKSKMIYASTKNTFLRSLSTSFHPILFINSPDELSFSGWKKVIDSLNTEDPLTEAELNKKLISDSSSLSSKPALVSDSSNSLLFELDETVKEILSRSKSSNTLISLSIDNETLKLIKTEENVSSSNFIDHVQNYQSPSYNLFINSSNDQFFILTCPSGSKVRERMVYATNKQGLVNYLKSAGWTFKKIIEVGDIDELELSALKDDESHEEQTSGNNRLRFSKPKGPRRR